MAVNWDAIIPNEVSPPDPAAIVDRDAMVAALGRYDVMVGNAGVLPPEIAAAATTDLYSGAAETHPFLIITGTASITSFGTGAPAGTVKKVRFTGTPTLVAGVNLATPSGSNLTVEAGSFAILLKDIPGWHVVHISTPSRMTGSPITDIQGYLLNNRFQLEEQQADGVSNGTTTASGTWLARGVTLVKVLDPGNLVEVTGGNFTLLAGTYDMRILNCFVQSNAGARGRLFNVTDSIAVTESLSLSGTAGAPATYNTNFFFESRFRFVVPSPSRVYRLEYRVALGAGTIGLGAHDGMSAGVEKYSLVEGLKVA